MYMDIHFCQGEVHEERKEETCPNVDVQSIRDICSLEIETTQCKQKASSEQQRLSIHISQEKKRLEIRAFRRTVLLYTS